MSSNYIEPFKVILEDFLVLLNKQSQSLVWKRPNEQDPLKTDFSFNHQTRHSTTTSSWEAVDSEKIRQKFYQKDACTLCARRMSYKKGQFEEESPELPLLMIVHNAFLGYPERTYHDPEVEKEFTQLVQESLKIPPKKLLVREVLRCHFGVEEIYNEIQIRNCQTHLMADIEKYRIKAILVIGEAAPIIFQDKTELSKRLNQISKFMDLPTMVTYGPSRISYMKKKRYPVEKIASQRQEIIRNIHQIKAGIEPNRQ